MMRKFKRLSISTQAGVLLALTLGATGSAFFFWANENAIKAELQHSRTVADMADSFRAMAAQHGGLYIRRGADDDIDAVGRYLAQYVSEKAEDGKQYVFHQKNPFLAIGDFSQAVQNSPAAAKFRITSDNYMNPANQPDLFDLAALKEMRENGVKESYTVVKNQFRYARALRAEKACLACHGNPQNAPEAVKSNYRAPIGGSSGGGYGYEEGQIVGVTSVSVPHMSAIEMLADQSLGFWTSVTVVLGLILTSFGLALRGVVQPLKQLFGYAAVIAEASDVETLKALKTPKFDAEESTSANEIHRQAYAVKSLHESMQAAMTHIERHRLK